MQNILARVLPFILLGIAIIAFILGMIILAYIFVIGAVLGLALFAFNWIRQKFFTPKQISVPKRRPQTINHDE